MSVTLEPRTGTLVTLRLLTVDDAEAMARVRSENREFFQPFEPSRGDEWFTVSAQRADIEAVDKKSADGAMHRFGAFANSDSKTPIGWITISCIERGPWQNANIGYSIVQAENGKGIATEVVRLAIEYAFKDLHLHRVQAAVLPTNVASIRVLEKNGFRYEGLALRYLYLNGKWEDHNIYAVTNDA